MSRCWVGVVVGGNIINALPVAKVVMTEDVAGDGRRLFALVMSQGLEGVMAKWKDD